MIYINDGEVESDFTDEASAPSPMSIEKLREKADELVTAQSIVDDLEEQLDAAKSALNNLKINIIPAAFAEAGVAEIKMENGAIVEVKDFVAGGLPKDETDRIAAIEYLDSIDGSGLIKTELSVFFPKDDRQKAIDLQTELKKMGFSPEVATSVHALSLQAFVREKLRKGDEINPAKLHMFVGKTTTVKFKKDKKEKAKKS